MANYAEGFRDIPGTTVFEASKSRMGYHLNMFCMSLMNAEKRADFKANEPAYLDAFPMTVGQRNAILDRDYNRMIELGGNIFFLVRIGATDGKSVLSVVAGMTGATQEDYTRMMLAGGRSIEGNRSLQDWANRG
jgi:protocatechuate 4,5-dioxygenase alpha chain